MDVYQQKAAHEVVWSRSVVETPCSWTVVLSGAKFRQAEVAAQDVSFKHCQDLMGLREGLGVASPDVIKIAIATMKHRSATLRIKRIAPPHKPDRPYLHACAEVFRT